MQFTLPKKFFLLWWASEHPFTHRATSHSHNRIQFCKKFVIFEISQAILTRSVHSSSYNFSAVGQNL